MSKYDLPRILTHTMYCPIDGEDLEWDSVDLPRKRVCEDHGTIGVYDPPNKIYGLSDHHMVFLRHLPAQQLDFDGDGISVDVLEQYDSFTHCPFCTERLHEHPHLRMTMMCRRHGQYFLASVDAGVILPTEGDVVKPPVLASRVAWHLKLDALFLRTYRLVPA